MISYARASAATLTTC